MITKPHETYLFLIFSESNAGPGYSLSLRFQASGTINSSVSIQNMESPTFSAWNHRRSMSTLFQLYMLNLNPRIGLELT